MFFLKLVLQLSHPVELRQLTVTCYTIASEVRFHSSKLKFNGLESREPWMRILISRSHADRGACVRSTKRSAPSEMTAFERVEMERGITFLNHASPQNFFHCSAIKIVSGISDFNSFLFSNHKLRTDICPIYKANRFLKHSSL